LCSGFMKKNQTWPTIKTDIVSSQIENKI